MRLAELAPEAVALAEAALNGNAAAEKAARVALEGRHSELEDRFAGRFPHRNTHSAGLTEGRFNRL